jgi:nicotinate-nucleotide adenylyltransferase
VKITALEDWLGTRATADTIDRLRAIYPGVTFVWLMGADNLVQFHRWGRWRDILRSVAVGVLARPGAGVQARLSVAARAFRVHQVDRGENLRGPQAAGLGLREPADERCLLDRDPGPGGLAIGGNRGLPG